MNIFEAIHGGEKHRLWIGGHRGHTSAVRENTTANFAEVLGMGVDYIEIDVQAHARSSGCDFSRYGTGGAHAAARPYPRLHSCRVESGV